ncbi:MAG TPA: fibrobacter succinogenes major paralogous domain-containing protein [Candidatus Cloacimonadota bacterium]|jgi:uncharacterized protein (TIGR02145 family)|nr:hypothetical protein [Acidobacteriota bacterium]HOD55671.1 fibrobacter succinogenes major paralogous domain-containing protein [Candidatus Cloacimonadota bacterium]
MKSLEILLVILFVLSLSSCEKEPEIVTDIDGNVYKTVTIGYQVWMAENLKTTKLNDSTGIPYVTSDGIWAGLATSGYCYYDNSWGNALIYGALYNWHTVNTGKLCPTGWHVPTNEEWTTLMTYLGGDTLIGGKLKETGTAFWLSPNRGATNETGFSARGGGNRHEWGDFVHIKECADFWSSTEHTWAWDDAIFIGLHSITSNPSKNYAGKSTGMSIRCIRD